jgi:hypothetical protein
MQSILEGLIFSAGIEQLALVVASVAIPHVLEWRAETAKLRPLTRQVFWTYAGYIWATNLSFGLVSILAPLALLDRSVLAGAVTGFMAVYWGARLVVQFAVLDRRTAPDAGYIRAAEAALVLLFVSLTVIYALAAVSNWGAFT